MISACQSLARLEENQQEKSKLEALDSKPRRSGEGRDKRGHASAEIRKKETHLGVLNMAYKLFTSSKSFDCRTGRGESTAPHVRSMELLIHRHSSWTGLPLDSRQ